MPSSALRTLPQYLQAMKSLIFELVMKLPPVEPTGMLRVTLFLKLTADLLEAIPGYSPLPPGDNDSDEDMEGIEEEDSPADHPLTALFTLFQDLDSAWVAVLSCQAWNSTEMRGQDIIVDFSSQTEPTENGTVEALSPSEVAIKIHAPTITDTTRLRSMIIAGISALEDWLDRDDIPHSAREPFEGSFEETLRLLGEDSNQVNWDVSGAQNEFVRCC